MEIIQQDNINALFFEDRRTTKDNDQLLEEIVFGEELNNEVSDKLEEEEQVVSSVWHDDDDKEQGIVHLSGNKRLRKLKSNMEENIVSTSQYEQKLRRLFLEKNSFALDWCRGDDFHKESHLEYWRATDDSLTTKDEKQTRRLRKPDWISLHRVADVNREDPCHSTVFATEFHPGGRLLLVGGLDKILRLFAVDGIANPKVESIHYANLPIRCAHFILDGSRILSAGRRRFLYEFDLVSGQSYQLLPFQGEL